MLCMFEEPNLIASTGYPYDTAEYSPGNLQVPPSRAFVACSTVGPKKNTALHFCY